MSTAEFWKLTEKGHWIGPGAASVVILVYSDYRCGFCEELHFTLRRLQQRYPQHVAVVMKHFVDPSTLTHDLVPLGAECAGEQDRFAEYNDAAFSDSAAVTHSDSWRKFAEAANVPDLAGLTQCVRSRQYAVKIAEQHAEGAKLGITGTPTLFVNGFMIRGAIPFADLDAVIAGRFPERRSDPS